MTHEMKMSILRYHRSRDEAFTDARGRTFEQNARDEYDVSCAYMRMLGLEDEYFAWAAAGHPADWK